MPSSPTTAYRPEVGDLVTVRGDHRVAGIVWKVAKLNRATADLESHLPADMPPCRAPFVVLGPYAPVAGVNGAQAFPTALPPVRDLPGQVLGAVVKVTGRDGYWVVLLDKFDKIKVARLGGDNNKYLTCPWKMITPVDAASILK